MRGVGEWRSGGVGEWRSGGVAVSFSDLPLSVLPNS
jgi:hypothetical protein